MDEERTYLNAIIRIRDGFERKEKMSDVYLFWQLVNGWAELIHKMW